MTKIIISFFLSAVFFYTGYLNSVAARYLTAGVSLIPPHAEVGKEGRPKGGFVDLVKAIDSVYTDGEIFIKVLPVKRAEMLLMSGSIDFHLPTIYMPKIPKEVPLVFVSIPIADVAFVLYTRADMKMLPMDELGKFHIEIL